VGMGRFVRLSLNSNRMKIDIRRKSIRLCDELQGLSNPSQEACDELLKPCDESLKPCDESLKLCDELLKPCDA
jgi:hypothetical protein